MSRIRGTYEAIDKQTGQVAYSFAGIYDARTVKNVMAKIDLRRQSLRFIPDADRASNADPVRCEWTDAFRNRCLGVEGHEREGVGHHVQIDNDEMFTYPYGEKIDFVIPLPRPRFTTAAFRLRALAIQFDATLTAEAALLHEACDEIANLKAQLAAARIYRAGGSPPPPPPSDPPPLPRSLARYMRKHGV